MSSRDSSPAPSSSPSNDKQSAPAKRGPRKSIKKSDPEQDQQQTASETTQTQQQGSSSSSSTKAKKPRSTQARFDPMAPVSYLNLPRYWHFISCQKKNVENMKKKLQLLTNNQGPEYDELMKTPEDGPESVQVRIKQMTSHCLKAENAIKTMDERYRETNSQAHLLLEMNKQGVKVGASTLKLLSESLSDGLGTVAGSQKAEYDESKMN